MNINILLKEFLAVAFGVGLVIIMVWLLGGCTSTKDLARATAAAEASKAGCLCIARKRNPDGSYAVAEGLTFVPGSKIVDRPEGGRMLVAI